jgi:hypothetical protein
MTTALRTTASSRAKSSYVASYPISTSSSVSTTSAEPVIESSISLNGIPLFSNSTSGSNYSSTMAGNAGPTTSVSPSSTAVSSSSSTKPAVGTTALGTSGADVVRAGGVGLVAVGSLFMWFL